MNARKMKPLKAMTAFFAAVGVLSWIFGVLTWVFGGDVFGHVFPKPENVHFGFALVGTLYLVMAAAMWALIKNKKRIMEETDERNQMIAAESAYVAFLVQTLLLGSGIFLLIFMGYLSHVAMMSLLVILLVSCLTYLSCVICFKFKM